MLQIVVLHYVVDMPAKAGLSDLEQRVMEVIWARGSVTANDVRDALAADRPLKDSTVRTILTRLEEKGYARHTVGGRTFVYSSLEPPRNVAVRAVKRVIDRFCHGSIESLLVGMVDDDIVDAEELRRIVSRLARERASKLRTKAKRKE